jgi:hypothetical protein
MWGVEFQKYAKWEPTYIYGAVLTTEAHKDALEMSQYSRPWDELMTVVRIPRRQYWIRRV